MSWNKVDLYTDIKMFQTKYPDFMHRNLREFCKEHRWNLIPYKHNASNFKEYYTLRKVSEDGFSVWEDGQYSIFYENTRFPSTRHRFTIAHEIGHIWLNHHYKVPAPATTYRSKRTVGISSGYFCCQCFISHLIRGSITKFYLLSSGKTAEP